MHYDDEVKLLHVSISVVILTGGGETSPKMALGRSSLLYVHDYNTYMKSENVNKP